MDAFIIAFFWAVYNTYVIFSALMEVFKKRHERKQYRFPVNMQGGLFSTEENFPYIKAQIVNLSITGAGFTVNHKIPAEAKNLMLKIRLLGFKDILIPIEKLHYQRKVASRKIFVGSSFSSSIGFPREQLFEYLFVYLPRIDAQDMYHVNEWDPARLVQDIFNKIFPFTDGSRPI
jgi:hypothetical protein